jgi:hypothetical protein
VTLHIYDDLEQGTEEWAAARRGICTASVVGKLISIGPPDPITVNCPTCRATAGSACLSMAAKKTPTAIKTIHDARCAAAADLPPVYGPADSDTARAITATLVAERIAGFTEDTSMSADMWRGRDAEPYARDLYAEHHAPVTECGFMRLDEEWGTLGYSPDGLVGDDGLIEIKAPRAKNHLLTVLDGKVPTHNLAQCQAGLLVSGRKWLDFIPYVAGLPLWVIRVTPDPAWHGAIKGAVSRFEQTAAEMTDAYLTATANLPATERVDFNLVELKL